MEGMWMGTAEEGSDLAFESKVREAANKRKDHSKLAFKALAEDFPCGPEKVALVVKNNLTYAQIQALASLYFCTNLGTKLLDVFEDYYSAYH